MSLRDKLLMLLVAVIAGLMAATVWFGLRLYGSHYSLVTEFLREKAQSAARSFAADAEVPLATKDRTKLSEMVAHRLLDRDASLAVVVDATGNVLAQKGVMDEAVTQRARSVTTAEVDDTRDGNTVAFAPVQIESQRLGIVAVAFSHARLSETRNQALGSGLVVLLAALIGVFVARVAAQRLLAPIHELRRIAMRIADGDLSGEVKVDSKDEVGELAATFSLMVQRLRAIADQARKIAIGDLSQRIEASGDLADAFNRMVKSLAEIVARIQKASLLIGRAADAIVESARTQEASATEQASSVEETRRTMEHLLAAASQIAGSSETVFESAQASLELSRTGHRELAESRQTIDMILASSRQIAERIHQLNAQSVRITEILDIIRGIADRSDLLALNAALEGSRAGEAGKGFSLVATEMRRLAENVMESVGDIKQLVDDIRISTHASVLATEEGMKVAERGATMVNHAGESFTKIVERVEQTTESARKITLITQQQRTGTEQITMSMDEITSLLNQTVAGTRQATTAAQQLAELAGDLREAAVTFTLGGKG